MPYWMLFTSNVKTTNIEPLSSKHYGVLARLRTKLIWIEQGIALNAEGDPTPETLYRLSPHIDTLARTLSTIGPSPHLQARHHQVIGKAFRTIEGRIKEYIEAEIAEDRPFCEGFLAEFAHALCDHYKTARSLIIFEEKDLKYPSFRGAFHFAANGSPCKIKVYRNPHNSPPLSRRPSARLKTVSHECIHYAQDRFLASLGKHRDVPLVGRYLGISRTILHSTRLEYLYYDPRLTFVMPYEADAMLAVDSMKPIWDRVDKLPDELLAKN